MSHPRGIVCVYVSPLSPAIQWGKIRIIWVNAIAVLCAKLKLILVARVAATITFVVFASTAIVATVTHTITRPVWMGAFAEAYVLGGCVIRVIWI